ncbi:MAG: hypothetical protein R2848_18230 [Thermomicrobiales bacterium]
MRDLIQIENGIGRPDDRRGGRTDGRWSGESSSFPATSPNELTSAAVLQAWFSRNGAGSWHYPREGGDAAHEFGLLVAGRGVPDDHPLLADGGCLAEGASEGPELDRILIEAEQDCTALTSIVVSDPANDLAKAIDVQCSRSCAFWRALELGDFLVVPDDGSAGVCFVSVAASPTGSPPAPSA